LINHIDGDQITTDVVAHGVGRNNNDNSSSSDLNTIHHLPLKRAWKVGSNIVVVIDKSIIKRLGISEENTLLQEEIVEGGILLRIVTKNEYDEIK
jgi:hypothetical protein